MGKYHIALLTGQHAVANPRVWKEAGVLNRQGYDVTIITLFYSEQKLELDRDLVDMNAIRYIPYLNLIGSNRYLPQGIFSKISRKASIWKKKIFGLDSAGLLGYSPRRLLKLALKADADLYIGHMEVGLWAGVELLKRGRRVSFDIEDWYSNDYLNALRPVALLKRLESEAIANGVFCTCPSDAMAKGINAEYAANSCCHTIYNGFSSAESNTISTTDAKPAVRTLVWFSQIIGPGRGLEFLMKSIKGIPFSFELNLIGEIDDAYRKYLEEAVKETNCKLILHGTVPHNRLLPLLGRYDVGLALENDYPLNKNTTVSNKILQYLQAGLKIIATETEGHAEVSRKAPGTVVLIQVGNIAQMAAAIEQIFESSVNCGDSKRYFREIFSLEAQEGKLSELVKEALSYGKQ